MHNSGEPSTTQQDRQCSDGQEVVYVWIMHQECSTHTPQVGYCELPTLDQSKSEICLYMVLDMHPAGVRVSSLPT